MLAAMDIDNLSKADAGVLLTRLYLMNVDPDPDAPEVDGAVRMTKGNSYANPCFTCGHVVPENTGYYFVLNGSWKTIHATGKCDTRPVEGIDLSHVPAGLYAVPGGTTGLKVRIDKPQAGRWEGHTFVKDGAVYGRGGMLGRCAPGQQYLGKAMEAIMAIAADPKEAAAEYGRITGTCGLCSRKLEDDKHVGPDGLTSVQRGIGPVCMTRF